MEEEFDIPLNTQRPNKIYRDTLPLHVAKPHRPIVIQDDIALDEAEVSEPLPKKNRVPLITPEAVTILESYVPPSNHSNQSLTQIYDKNWKTSAQEIAQFEDAMDIDVQDAVPIRQNDYQKEVFEKTKPPPKKLEVKIIDEIPEERKKNVSSSSTSHIMNPALLNERHHDIATQFSKTLNESAQRKLIAVDKSVYDTNIEADAFIRIAMEDFTKLFQSMNVRIFNPDHVPSTAEDGMDVPPIPELSRVYMQKYMRAPVFENHERTCVRNENCDAHKVFVDYRDRTANNTMAGPQFPPGTQSFALREFLLPEHETQIVERLKQGESMAEITRTMKHQTCLFCTLNIVTNWAIMAASKNAPIVAPVILQTFKVKVGTPGEYNENALLTCGSNNLYGLVAPTVEFDYSNYVPFVYNVPLNQELNKVKVVMGWAEVNDILCEPSVNVKPRGYTEVQSQGEPAGHTWRSRSYQESLRKNAIYNVQVNRMTGDTFQTGSATTTRYKERKFTEAEKKNPHMFPYFKRHEWLIGNQAFIESTTPLFKPYKPITGTGTCELPTTTHCLRSFFADPVSQVVFTDTLSLYKEPENLRTLSNYSDTTRFLMAHKPYWVVTDQTIKPEFVGTPLLEWITLRLNWAYYKRDIIRRLYDRQLSFVNTNIYLHNNWTHTRRDMDAARLPIGQMKTPDELEALAKHTPYAYFLETLESEMEENNITIMSVTMRSTALPVHSQLYDPYISRDELSSTMTSGPDVNPEVKKFVSNNTTLTYHRYWALYYIKLLDHFIESHGPICQTMAKDTEYRYGMPESLKSHPVETVVKQYQVVTQYHPFDEVYAKWNWTPMRGYQGSRAILGERFPEEIIFKYPFVYLYHIMKGKLPTHMISVPEQAKIREKMVQLAEEARQHWHKNPLFPYDLLHGNTKWTIATQAPFEVNSFFLWTILAITGRIEHLKTVISETEKDEQTLDFYLYQLQVRLTGYLPLMRWMLTELLIESPTHPKQPTISDLRVTEAVEFFHCDDIDFDGEWDMPRLSILLHMLNYWYNAGSYTKKNPILAALQKGIPFRSTARVLSNHFFNETKRNYHFISLTMMFATVNTLGLFRRQRGAPPMYRPNFANMVKIDYALLQTPKQLFNFIHVTKSKIIIYMSREVLVHAMTKAPHYRNNQLLNWNVLEKHTWEVCNNIRKYLCNYKFWLKAPFNVARLNLEDDIQMNHEQHYDLFLFPQQDFLHTILSVFYSQHIKHLDKIMLLQMELRNLLQQPPNEELEFKIRHIQAQLSIITYELDEPTRKIIWQTLIGTRSDIHIWSLVRQFVSNEDLILFHRLNEEYSRYTPKKKLELTVSQFSLRAFTMIYYLLQTQYKLRQYHLVALPPDMTQDIHQAMREKRHHLAPTQPLHSSVYHVNVTMCCGKVATMTDTGSYGNSLVMYSRKGNYLACCRKRTKKTGYTVAKSTKAPTERDDENEEEEDEEEEEEEEQEQEQDEEEVNSHEHEDESAVLLRKIEKRQAKLHVITESTKKLIEKTKKKFNNSSANLIDKTRIGKDVTMEDYPNMSFKERRKIVCRLDMDTRSLECKSTNPPVVTFNLQGRQLCVGSEYAKMTTYQHCPKCGDLHTFSTKHYNGGQGYMCANCVQKYWVPSLDMQRVMFCVYCGRQHFKDVKQGMRIMNTIDVGDVNMPIKLFNYCHTDQPKYKYDYFFDRHNPKESINMLCLDTYLNRHHNMLRQECIAHFPFQNTIQEDMAGVSINNNDFSWPLYGKRVYQIPHLIDVWWPPCPYHEAAS